jgi:hypothetical protein
MHLAGEPVGMARMRVIARLLRALASAARSSTGTGSQFECLNYRGLPSLVNENSPPYLLACLRPLCILLNSEGAATPGADHRLMSSAGTDW